MPTIPEFFITNNLAEWSIVPRGAVIESAMDAIAVLLPYRLCESEALEEDPGRHFLRVGSFAAWNHYRALADKLKALTSILRADFGLGKHEVRVAVNSRLGEKQRALEAGLGWIGKSGLLVNPRYGSACVIGLVLFPETETLVDALSEMRLEALGSMDSPADGSTSVSTQRAALGCGSCTACIDACPTGALTDGFTKERCLQFWMSRGGMPAELALHRGNRLYGCDDCVKACPYTQRGQDAPELDILEAGYSAELRRPGPLVPAADLAGKSAEEARDYFRGTALGLSWLPFDDFSLFAAKQCEKG